MASHNKCTHCCLHFGSKRALLLCVRRFLLSIHRCTHYSLHHNSTSALIAVGTSNPHRKWLAQDPEMSKFVRAKPAMSCAIFAQAVCFAHFSHHSASHSKVSQCLHSSQGQALSHKVMSARLDTPRQRFSLQPFFCARVGPGWNQNGFNPLGPPMLQFVVVKGDVGRPKGGTT